jgi:proteic killer suppression protein
LPIVKILYPLGKEKYNEACLEIQFKDKKIRQLCEQRVVAERKLGAICARKLSNRLSDLEAAKSVSQLAFGNPHPLKGNKAGMFALDLAGGWRLVFSPANQPTPTLANGSTDWTQVTIVCIEYIGDYHD